MNVSEGLNVRRQRTVSPMKTLFLKAPKRKTRICNTNNDKEGYKELIKKFSVESERWVRVVVNTIKTVGKSSTEQMCVVRSDLMDGRSVQSHM